MGNLTSLAWRGIRWIGNCILIVISWWDSFKDRVNQNTFNVLIRRQDQILNALNPQGVGEIIAINDEKSQLEDIASRYNRNLTFEDRQRIDLLLDQRDY